MKTAIRNWLKRNWIDVAVTVSIITIAVTVFFLRGTIASAFKGILDHWLYSLCVLIAIGVWLGRKHTWPAIQKAGLWTFSKTSTSGRWLKRHFVSANRKNRLLFGGIGLVVLAVIVLLLYFGFSFIAGRTNAGNTLPFVVATLTAIGLAFPFALLLAILIILRRVMGKSLGPTVGQATKWMWSFWVVVAGMLLIAIASGIAIWFLKPEWVKLEWAKTTWDWVIAHWQWVACIIVAVTIILWLALKKKGGQVSFKGLAKTLVPIAVVAWLFYVAYQTSSHVIRSDENKRMEVEKSTPPGLPVDPNSVRMGTWDISATPDQYSEWVEYFVGRNTAWKIKDGRSAVMMHEGKLIDGKAIPTDRPPRKVVPTDTVWTFPGLAARFTSVTGTVTIEVTRTWP